MKQQLRKELNALKHMLYKGDILRNEKPGQEELWERFDSILKTLYP